MKNIKKIIIGVVALIVIANIFAGGKDKKEDKAPAETTVVETTVAETEPALVLSPEYEGEKADLQMLIANHILENYKDTDIETITINDNLGTDADGDYIALVNLTWNVKNKPDTTKKMLTMYSDDLAATLGTDAEPIVELAVFWEVPYINGNGKFAYERKGNGMAISDVMTNGF